MAEEVKRYEVLTQEGFCVGVPRRVWKAWPLSNRRLIVVDSDEAARLEAAEWSMDAEELRARVKEATGG